MSQTNDSSGEEGLLDGSPLSGIDFLERTSPSRPTARGRQAPRDYMRHDYNKLVGRLQDSQILSPEAVNDLLPVPLNLMFMPLHPDGKKGKPHHPLQSAVHSRNAERDKANNVYRHLHHILALHATGPDAWDGMVASAHRPHLEWLVDHIDAALDQVSTLHLLQVLHHTHGVPGAHPSHPDLPFASETPGALPLTGFSTHTCRLLLSDAYRSQPLVTRQVLLEYIGLLLFQQRALVMLTMAVAHRLMGMPVDTYPACMAWLSEFLADPSEEQQRQLVATLYVVLAAYAADTHFLNQFARHDAHVKASQATNAMLHHLKLLA